MKIHLHHLMLKITTKDNFDSEKLSNIRHMLPHLWRNLSQVNKKKISSGLTSKQYGSWFVTSNTSISYSLFLTSKLESNMKHWTSWKLQSVFCLLWNTYSLLKMKRCFCSKVLLNTLWTSVVTFLDTTCLHSFVFTIWKFSFLFCIYEHDEC